MKRFRFLALFLSLAIIGTAIGQSNSSVMQSIKKIGSSIIITFKDGSSSAINDCAKISSPEEATRVGCMVYTCGVSGSSDDIAYNGGNKCTLTNNGSGASLSNTTRAWIILKQLSNGAWMIQHGKAVVQWGTTDSAAKNMQITGITFKNVSNFFQPVLAWGSNTGSCGAACTAFVAQATYVQPNDDFIIMNASVTGVYNWGNMTLDGIELNAKPNFAY